MKPTNDMMPEADERGMQMALEEAREAFRRGEVPVGAIITAPSGAVIGRGHNLTEALTDVTAHAEMQALTAAADTLGGKYLHGCTLYVTVEPCIMCAGALGWSQISRIVYGATDIKRGFASHFIAKGSPSPLHPKTEVRGGVCSGECAELMTDFFRRRR